MGSNASNAGNGAQKVFRIYVEKKEEHAAEARALTAEIRELLGISSVERIRVVNRYDVEGAGEKLMGDCTWTVFAEPQTDIVHKELDKGYSHAFAVEYLPGQYDQRADAVGQCIALVSQNFENSVTPAVRTGKVYLFYGKISGEEIAAIKKYMINPVECQEVTLENYETLAMETAVPEDVPVLHGFSSAKDSELPAYLDEYSLAMDINDIRCCRDYFAREGRDPTFTELKVLDTYWSDHCRHTTFLTAMDNIEFKDEAAKNAYGRYLELRKEFYNGDKPDKDITLMDMATIAAKYLRKKGLSPSLDKLDISEEVNACTVKIDVNVRDEKGTERKEPWLLYFKNETHNHPTEMEPFGGASTCLGGGIRDPLSGRSCVYQAMRLTGAADPRRPLSETMPGKLPQRKITKTAAAGYSSYGNQAGLAAGLVDEIYHEGYAAKRMEIGALVAAVPQADVVRGQPADGDAIILLGGRTGRDGCGGATGSSKSHTEESLAVCGAEVQKGNAPEGRKIQRLFCSPEATRMIKRCNDFGAGGVSVAIGEIADGVSVNLDKIPTKYEGLNGTELAISESQERMAIVVDSKDVRRFIELANLDNLEATVIGVVTSEPRLVLKWRGKNIADISREFINTSGAAKHVESVIVEGKSNDPLDVVPQNFVSGYHELVAKLNICSKRGLIEFFDSTIGRGAIFMPLGGARQRTPVQVMAAKMPGVDTDTASVMSWGFDPELSSISPFEGAYAAVVSSVAKLAASGASLDQCYLSFQEYFGKPNDPKRWGKPTAALLGALSAQLDIGIASVGGKDSMSGTFEKLDVPPTLVSFAVAVSDARGLISPEFKNAGSKVVILEPEHDENSHIPKAESFNKILREVNSLIISGAAISVYAVAMGGVAEAIFKMCTGNGLGFKFADDIKLEDLFTRKYGAFMLELKNDIKIDGAKLIGTTKPGDDGIVLRDDMIPIPELEQTYDDVLEDIFPTRARSNEGEVPLIEAVECEKRVSIAPKFVSLKPQVLIPAFCGISCERDSAAYAEMSGAAPKIFVPRTRTPSDTRESVKEFASLLSKSEILFIPGGFSYGDDPDETGKFTANFLRNPYIAEEITKLLDERGGLILGISGGFQALMKLGLLPYGKMIAPSADSPALTHNLIGRHQARIVKVRVVSNMSPWLAGTVPGEIFDVPVSHGEGRFVCPEELYASLSANGQITTQYVDSDGVPSMSADVNPAGSFMAVEGLTSPDGRVFGKIGHTERFGRNLYVNVSGNINMKLFESAVKYFRG
ncbi:MAG: phosphoribosylformylglycinamidine synthase [Synergistaceae bacterium]|nr:phosphoribosylformylglycinamidine synthase [Synergistaceae bacterium]